MDKVPGVCFVGTSFFYIFFIPIIPLRSYIVREGDDDWLAGFKGVPIGFNVKSILFAWIRAAAIVTIVWYVGRFITGWWQGPREFYEGANNINEVVVALDVPGWNGVLIIALCTGVLLALKAMSYASAGRAAELTAIAKAGP